VELVLKSFIIFCFSLLFIADASAERCASPDEVRDRLISADYDWSVSEDVSLGGLLSVTKLYGVSIENYGEFVACKYEAAQQFIRLDGSPKVSKCPVRPASEKWFLGEGGKTICDEDDYGDCRFEFGCAESP
jgi:hypothetical protein